jgi:hypothetical protein
MIGEDTTAKKVSPVFSFCGFSSELILLLLYFYCKPIMKKLRNL